MHIFIQSPTRAGDHWVKVCVIGRNVTIFSYVMTENSSLIDSEAHLQNGQSFQFLEFQV